MSENNNIWLKTLFDYMEKSKIMGKERKIVEELINENIRLNNIINELEDYLEHARIEVNKISKEGGAGLLMIINKLQELKGSDKE